MHPGLKKLFTNLSKASQIVERRNIEREKVHEQFRNVKKKTKKEDIVAEMKKLEKQLSLILSKKEFYSKKNKNRVFFFVTLA